MHPFLLGVRKACGIVFSALGVVLFAIGGIGASVYWWLSTQGEPFDGHDREMSIALVVFAALGAVILVAGIFLLRPAHPRFVSAGSRGRDRSMVVALSTFLWPAAAVLWFFLAPNPGVNSARLISAVVGFAALYFGIHVFIFCHEMGHLIMARVLRMEVERLQVGTGRLLAGGSLGGVRFEWRALHGGGFVMAGTDQERFWRLRRWLMIAGGPAAHLAGCFLLAWWLRQQYGVPWASAGWYHAPGFFALFLLWFEAYRLLFVFLPTSARLEGRALHTDGYWLLRLPFLSAAVVRQTIVVHALTRAERLWKTGRHAESLECFERARSRYPGHPGMSQAAGAFLALQGRHDEAAVYFRSELETAGLSTLVRARLGSQCFLSLALSGDPAAAREFGRDLLRDTAPEARAEVLDALVTQVLLQDLRAFLPEADEWSQEAYSLEPLKITRQATRGSVLVALGRGDEGAALLRDVWTRSTGELDAMLSAFYLALAARQRGDARELRLWRGRLLTFRIFIGSDLQRRLESELGTAPATGGPPPLPVGLAAVAPCTPPDRCAGSLAPPAT